MPSPLSAVTSFFASTTPCTVNRLSNRSVFSDNIHFLPYDSGVARKSTMYDRMGIISENSLITIGDIIKIGDSDEEYIVSTAITDHFFGGITRKQINLVFVQEKVSVYRLAEAFSAGEKVITKTLVYSGAYFAYKKIETSEINDLRTIKENYYGIFPRYYTVLPEDVIVTSFGTFSSSGSILMEDGLTTCIIAEDRSSA